MTYRYDLINFLINEHNLSNYLEIGYQQGICFSNVIAKNKKAVENKAELAFRLIRPLLLKTRFASLNTKMNTAREQMANFLL